MRRIRTVNKFLMFLYGVLALCITVFIFGLLFIPSQSQQFENTISNCSGQKIQDVANLPQLPIVYFGGSTTFAPLNKPVDKPGMIATIQKAHPQFLLEYVDPAKHGETPGSGTGIKWLIKRDRNLSFAQSSRPLNDKEIEDANRIRMKLKQQEIAYDIIAIYVNPQLIEQGLQGLSLAQVRDIFTRNIKNWKDVGGPDVKIAPFRRNSADSGTVDFFKKNVMKKQEFGSNVAPIGQKREPEEQITTLAIRKVASTPGGISFATASEVINQEMIRILPIAKEDTPTKFVSPCAEKNCKAVDTNLIAKQSYPTEFYRKLYVIIKQDGGQDEKAGEAYANMLKSCEGKQLVKQAGFVPL